MPKRTSKTGGELFIVDNSDDDWKVLRYLRDWCDLSKGLDVATGYFEIGSLLALDGQWQKLDKIRLLIGDEVSKRTLAAFAAGLEQVEARLDRSLEAEKEKNDFLAGAPAIVDAIRSGQIECRVYRKDKFHAKAYITHARQEVIGSFALVGSSNMTFPGWTENIELNVQIAGTPVGVLQEWYEQHWAAAEDVSADILRTIERHVREPPKVADYELKKSYGRLLDMVDQAFRNDKPLFVLGIYYPLAYYRGPDATIDPWIENRQKQVCGLIRSQFLKRFESSARAFEQSCERLLLKLLAWVTKHCVGEPNKRRLERWKQKHAELADHPELAALRGKVAYWNFLPPRELDELLKLYNKVTHKTLRISKTLGIETGKLLRPDDDFEALKEFNHAYEGETSTDEKLQLELNELLAAEPELAARLEGLPGRVFSGKAHPTEGARGVFFCYRLPRAEAGRADGEVVWTEEAGMTRWYLYDLDRDAILEEPAEIVAAVRSHRDTPRRCAMPQTTLVAARAKIEKHVKNTFLKRLQAPLGVKPVLKAWMELN